MRPKPDLGCPVPEKKDGVAFPTLSAGWSPLSGAEDVQEHRAASSPRASAHCAWTLQPRTAII